MESPNRIGEILTRTKALQKSLDDIGLPPSEVQPSKSDPVLPRSLFKQAPPYVRDIVHQRNTSYTHACYDASAVMARRLIESLIVEAFEHSGIGTKIKDNNGNYWMLEKLVNITLAETTWNLNKNSKKGLKDLKTVGDQSAHSRSYTARREYIDDLKIDLRTVAEQLLYLAGWRK
jgi:hypothetical protein